MPSTAYAGPLSGFSSWISGILSSAASVVTGLIGSVVSSVSTAIAGSFLVLVPLSTELFPASSRGSAARSDVAAW